MVLGACLTGAAAAGMVGQHVASSGSKAPLPDLANIVPRSFDDWREVPLSPQIISPQTQQLLDSLYSELLSRTYRSAQGYSIMLSIAYGNDQRGSLAVHKPEVCYPAQGFALIDTAEVTLTTPFGGIPARQLRTALGARQEPVTYWLTVSGATLRSAWEKRLIGFRLALTGQIPDGLLFRVSSIDADAKRAWSQHSRFVQALLTAASPQARERLTGLTGV